jgi:hypothetical protein
VFCFPFSIASGGLNVQYATKALTVMASASRTPMVDSLLQRASHALKEDIWSSLNLKNEAVDLVDLPP